MTVKLKGGRWKIDLIVIPLVGMFCECFFGDYFGGC
jgi:hypothetical protein